tara:strand:- start:9 stop:494 length:486 start_codon:yes stop_codon:yes gene_type:complete
MAWGKNGTPDTLGGTADVLTISDLTAKKFNQIMTHIISSGTTNSTAIMNNDSTSVYAFRYSENGAADGTGTSQAIIDSDSGTPAADLFKMSYFVSISGEEKLYMSFSCQPGTAGAGTAPSRREWIAKYVPSPDADVTEFEWNNAGAGDYAISTNISALGTD